MTQIKLRRDTSAAFASSNPILGNGEPAYETDTKKLKIGDGTTAYTQLEYFSAGGGGSTNISAILPLKIVDGVISLEVDGQTIQIVDGKLTASSTAPTNMVTTDTAQSITGHKSFSGELTIDKIDGDYGLYISTHPLKGAIRFGNTKRDVIIAGKGITTEAGDKFLTSGDKETIMGYMMPDYSTRTEVPWNTDNTAPTDGYVEVFGEGDGSTSAFVLEYTINGVKTAVSSCFATSQNTNSRLPVICPKGTVYSAKGGALGHDLHFISMKGAV